MSSQTKKQTDKITAKGPTGLQVSLQIPTYIIDFYAAQNFKDIPNFKKAQEMARNKAAEVFAVVLAGTNYTDKSDMLCTMLLKDCLS